MLRNNFFRFLLLVGSYIGIKHYTDHHCIAISAVCALLFLAGNRDNSSNSHAETKKSRKSPLETWEQSGDTRFGRA
jgi:hypothetical protein